MKKTITFLAVLLSVTIINAQSFNFEWANSITGNSVYEEGHGIGVDANDNIYIASYFGDTVDVDPTSGVSTIISSGGTDVIIQKQNSDGNVIWTKTIGGVNDEKVVDLVVDPLGNSYILGTFSDTVDFDPSVNTYNVDGQGNGIFILKLDQDGNFVWVSYAHSNALKKANDIALNKTNTNILVTGYFSYSFILSSNSGDQTIFSNGSYDTYVIRLDTQGNTLLLTHFGGSNQETGYGIASDNDDNVYIAGYVSGTANLDPNGTYEITPVGSWDAYLNKLDSSGSFLWAKSIGSTAIDLGQSVVCDNFNNVYFVGYFKDTIDLNPNVNTDIYYSSSDNMFIEKLNPNGDYLWGHAIQTGTSKPKNIAVKNNAIYICGFSSSTTDFSTDTNTTITTGVSGSFIAKYMDDGMLDKVSGIGNSISTVAYGLAVSSNENTVYSNGRYQSTVDFDPGSGVFEMTSANGNYDTYVQKLYDCISTNTIINEQTCDSYTSPSGNYTWTSTGVYNDTLISQYGCDSIITINLIIDTVNISVTQDTSSLTADVSGAVYQWLDCDNNYAIMQGETNQVFYPSADGNYAVEITQNGCTDTSDCYLITLVNVETLANKIVAVYPNPAHSFLAVYNTATIEYIEILDVAGRIIKQQTANDKQLLIDVSGLQNGLYFMRIKNNKRLIRFIKE